MIYSKMTSPELGRAAKKCIALLPIGALEQHGQHLPVGTDTEIVTEIARRAERALPRTVALLPTLWPGCSHHHLGFPGTVSLSNTTFIQILTEIAECLNRMGFRHIVLLNGHGGNILPGNEALQQLNFRWNGPREPWIAMATYWKVAARELATQRFMKTRNLSHACEYETSLMLALRADWVKMKLAKAEKVRAGSRFYSLDDAAPPSVTVCESFHQMTRTGALGSPEAATAVKGRKLLDLIVPVVVEFLRDFYKWKHPRIPKRTGQKPKIHAT